MGGEGGRPRVAACFPVHRPREAAPEPAMCQQHCPGAGVTGLPQGSASATGSQHDLVHVRLLEDSLFHTSCRLVSPELHPGMQEPSERGLLTHAFSRKPWAFLCWGSKRSTDGNAGACGPAQEHLHCGAGVLGAPLLGVWTSTGSSGCHHPAQVMVADTCPACGFGLQMNFSE